jgi:hypothetical protein
LGKPEPGWPIRSPIHRSIKSSTDRWGNSTDLQPTDGQRS